MPEPTPTAYPVRLDELINAIKRVHSDVLDQLSDAVLAAEHLGEHRSGVDKSRAEADLITTLASLTGANAAGATDAGATDAG